MKPEDVHSIVRLVRSARTADLVIVSLVVLPVILSAWSVLLWDLFGVNPTARIVAYVVIALVYAVGLIVMKIAESSESRDERSKQTILNELRGFRQRSFEFLRKRLGDRFTDDYFRRLIQKYPEELGQIGIKGGKPGVRIVESERE